MTSVCVSLIVEVQIMQDLQHFARASDYFLGKSIEEIGSIVLNVLQAHLQDVYGQLTLKCIQEGTSNSSEFHIKFKRFSPIIKLCSWGSAVKYPSSIALKVSPS